MVGCSILGCKSRSEKNFEGITFHKFPCNEKIKKIWLDATGRQNWFPSKYSRICSIHFMNESFKKTKMRVELKQNAVPEKLIPFSSSKKRSSKVLQEVQNVQPEILSLVPIGSNKRTSNNDVIQEHRNVVPKLDCLAGPSNMQIAAKSSSICNYHLKEDLKLHNIKKIVTKSSLRLKKIRALRESKRRLLKKTVTLENIIAELKSKLLIKSDDLDVLANVESENVDFLKRYFDKENRSRKYSPSLRKFALCLHFISPKAYSFVRKQFDTCLPHPNTLYKWYRSVDCEPGFTNESFASIKLIVEKSSEKLLCSVSLDEMSIRQHLQWDGNKTVGYVNVGDNQVTDHLPLAKDALVFMVTPLNGNWKIPVGYFLTNGVNGEQRSALLKNCVRLLLKCGVQIVSVTFDGCPANFAMAKDLGAKFDDVNKIQTKIIIEGQNMVIFPDVCHMLKLVRNTLADKKELINVDKEIISWKYLENLHNLQQNEGLHLANKIRNAHINFKNQIMKVRLAAQTFSRSVAKALLYCKNDLKIEEFSDSGATIEFITYFNDIFDIFNSRRLCTHGFKKPISKNNFDIINAKLKDFENFVKSLKFVQGELVIKSSRKTGFLGFLICIQAIRIIFNEHINIEDAPIRYVCTYKMSQDHLETFFSAIRSKGGFNNNPTALQFKSAYRRLLIHGELKNITTGNCIPLESINILTCTMKSVCSKINSRKERLLAMTDCDEVQDLIIDLPESHDYIGNCEMSEFSRQATIYIAGFIIQTLKKLVKCEECLGAITSHQPFSSFILHKDVGGLHYPSQDVIKICLYAEKILKQTIVAHGNTYFANKNSLPKMICHIFKKFINTQIFQSLTEHIKEQSPLDNHISLLIRAISLRYLEVRVHFIMKSISEKDERIRNMHNKLILFRGQ